MIKKALVALLSSAILATTVVSGVVATPTVAYAEETKVIKITENDCIAKDETGYDLEAVFGEYGGIIKACDADVYFLEFGRVDGDLLLYQLPSIASGSSVVIDTGRYKYTIDSSYTITDVLSAEQEEKDNERAKVNKWISDMVICKHPSAGNITLSASEKKGTLTVNKADIKAATKLDMMLKSKKAVTVKIKASSKSKAVKQLERLQKLIGHANTYGVQFWTLMDKPDGYYEFGLPEIYSSKDNKTYKNYIRSSQLKKSGSFYSIDIHKLVSQNYTYLCKAYENAFKRAKKRNTGYDFVKGTHLCDCSDISKLRVISELITNTHEHRDCAEYRFGSSYEKKLARKDEFKALASNKHYGVYACGELAGLADTIAEASGFSCTFDSKPRHEWAVFRVKDSSGKTVKATIDNGTLGWDSIVTGSKLLDNNDSHAMTMILGVYRVALQEVYVK